MKTKHSEEEHENHERWLVSYADFITLLFAFFVVLYATSNQNLDKEKKFQDSIRQEFKYPSVGSSLNNNLLVPTVSSGQPIDDVNQKIRSKLISSADVEDSISKSLEEKLGEAKADLVASLRHETNGVRLALPSDRLFVGNSAKLNREVLPLLGKIAEVLKATNYRLLVEGHTDDSFQQGDSGWELGALRSTQFVRYLVKVHGLDPKRLAAVSYGDQRPLAANTNDENRAKNRRIEIMFITTETPFDDL